MKAIAFADIDGVLNSARNWGHRTCAAGLDPALVKVLNDFCLEVDAEVVITSTWRRFRTLDELRAMFVEAGLTVPVRDVTPILNEERRYEINSWRLDEAPDLPFVIFDDDRDADLAGHFVHIEGSTGITRDHTARAVRLLAAQADYRS